MVAAAAASAAKPTTSALVAPAVAAVAAAPVEALDATFINYTGQDHTEALEVIVLMASEQEKVPTVL